MAEIVELLRIWIEEVIHAMGYPGITLVMLLENLFPPIPSEIVMPFTGFLVSHGRMDFWLALLFGTLGSVLGAIAIYWAGRVTGEERARTWIRRYGKYLLLQEDDLCNALEAFERRGPAYLLVGRLIPGVRSLISLPAGVRRMSFMPFLIYSLVGTVAWNVLLLWAGVLLGSQWQQVLNWIQVYEWFIWAAVGIALAVFLSRRLGLFERVKRGLSTD